MCAYPLMCMVRRRLSRCMGLRGCNKEPLASAVILDLRRSACTGTSEQVGRHWSAGRLVVAGGAVDVPRWTGAGVASVAMGPGVGDGIDAVEKNTCQPPVLGAGVVRATLVRCIEGGRVDTTEGNGSTYMIVCCNGYPRLLLVHRLLLVAADPNGGALLGHFIDRARAIA